jgi:hypothetical protein
VREREAIPNVAHPYGGTSGRAAFQRRIGYVGGAPVDVTGRATVGFVGKYQKGEGADGADAVLGR